MVTASVTESSERSVAVETEIENVVGENRTVVARMNFNFVVLQIGVYAF